MPQQRPRRPAADNARPGGRSSSRKEFAAQVRSLPAPLRIARAAELLYFPVVGFMLLGLPVPANRAEALATAFLSAQAIAAVAVAVGLGRRRRWAWVLALVLAAWVILGIVLRGGDVVRAAFATPSLALRLSVALLAWTFLTQLIALAGCLSTRNWREVLR
jgi:hypothetical protein